MKRFLILFIPCFFSLKLAYNQTGDYVRWCFGDSASILFDHGIPIPQSSPIRCRGAVNTFTDDWGNVRLMTHSGYWPVWQTGSDWKGVVYNSNGQVMENGDSLIALSWYNDILLVPDPGNPDRFYIFHTDIPNHAGLFMSLADLSYVGGLGKLTQKNVLFDSLNGEIVSDCLAAVKHGNGRDWWVIFHTCVNSNNSIYRILITPNGLSAPQTQQIGIATIAGIQRYNFSNNGEKLIFADVTGVLELYNFDRCTGLLSNRIEINPATYAKTDRFQDCAFSPNDSVLYVSVNDTLSILEQFDLSAANISSTRQTIYSFTVPRYGAGDLRTGPDGRVYWSIQFYDGFHFNFPYADSVYNNVNMNLSVVNHPNIIGSACDFQPYSFNLGGKRTYIGLGIEPDYRLPQSYGSLCDTLSVFIPEQLGQSPAFSVYYSSDWRKVFINGSHLQGATGRLIVSDMMGHLLIDEPARIENGYYMRSLELPNLASGIYVAMLYTGSGRLTARFFIN